MPPGGRKPRGGPRGQQRTKPLKKGKEKKKGEPKPGGWRGLAAVVTGFLAVVGVGVWSMLKEEKEARERDKGVRARLGSKPLVITDHASCRMDCRFVSGDEVRGALSEGRVLPKHSHENARPCPKYALKDGRVRAIFADCPKETVLVTVMDTVTDHPCGPC